MTSVNDLSAVAITTLTGERWAITDAAGHVPPRPGLYAIYGDETALQDLQLEQAPTLPLYVGKAEDSLVSRDLNGHFAVNARSKPRTGGSTVRRSFAALLRDALNLHAAPRNLAKPERFANYGLAEGGDERLNEWMCSHLTLAVWPAPPDLAVPLARIETEVIEYFTPPINITKNPGKLARLRQARAEMAAEASRWRGAMKLEVTTTPRETLVWAPTVQDAAELRRLLEAADCLVLPVDPWELDFFAVIPNDERDEFDGARIINVEIGPQAYDALSAIVDGGHELRWHRWQRDQDNSSAWGVPIARHHD